MNFVRRLRRLGKMFTLGRRITLFGTRDTAFCYFFEDVKRFRFFLVVFKNCKKYKVPTYDNFSKCFKIK